MGNSTKPLSVRGDLDLGSAAEERERVLEFMNGHDEPTLSMTLDREDCTQPSLQIFVAALKEATVRGISVSAGPSPLAKTLTSALETQQEISQ